MNNKKIHRIQNVRAIANLKNEALDKNPFEVWFVRAEGSALLVAVRCGGAAKSCHHVVAEKDHGRGVESLSEGAVKKGMVTGAILSVVGGGMLDGGLDHGGGGLACGDGVGELDGRGREKEKGVVGGMLDGGDGLPCGGGVEELDGGGPRERQGAEDDEAE